MALQADGKIVVVGWRGDTGELRARPLQPERFARHELLRRRQADDRILGPGDGGERGGDPGGRQDRRGRQRERQSIPATSRSPATTRTGRSTRASPATASRRPTSAGFDGATAVALQGDGKIVAVGAAGDDFALARYNVQRLARHDLLRRRQADDRLRWDRRAGDRGGDPGRRQDRRGWLRPAAATSRSPATTPNGSLDPSFSGDGKQTTDFGGTPTGRRGGDPGRRQDRRGRARRHRRRDFALARYNPDGVARHELLRRRQADDRLRGLRRGNRGGAPGRRQDRRGRLARTRSRFGSDFALARYNSDGSLDPSFSGDGKQTTDFAGDDGRAGWRSRATARSSSSATARRRLRARPLQPERLARHELLRRRQADDRLRRHSTGRAGWRSRATARSSWSARGGTGRRLRARPLQPQRLARHDASPATASRRPTSGTNDGATGVALQANGKIVAVGCGRTRKLQRRLRARPLQPKRLARHELLRRRQADD